jgi:hypothetical protein
MVRTVSALADIAGYVHYGKIHGFASWRGCSGVIRESNLSHRQKQGGDCHCEKFLHCLSSSFFKLNLAKSLPTILSGMKAPTPI